MAVCADPSGFRQLIRAEEEASSGGRKVCAEHRNAGVYYGKTDRRPEPRRWTFLQNAARQRFARARTLLMSGCGRSSRAFCPESVQQSVHAVCFGGPAGDELSTTRRRWSAVAKISGPAKAAAAWSLGRAVGPAVAGLGVF